MKTKSTFFLLTIFLSLLFFSACDRANNMGSVTADPVPVGGLAMPELAAEAENAPEPTRVAPDAPSSTEQESADMTEAAEPAGTLTEAPADLLAQQNGFIAIYNRVNPGVVHINTGGGQGSGFVYDRNGFIVTNNHVVAGAQQISVTFADGQERSAQLVGTDPASDLAVLRLDPDGLSLTPLPLADSARLQVGQIVIAIGSPFGLSGTMTTGIISGLDRQYPGATSISGGQFLIPDVIQTDAAINPGNSGGPLFDLYGGVIGVNTAIESPVRGSSGIGYAIPANIISKVVPQLIQNGAVQHPWLGIAGSTLNAGTAAALGLEDSQTGILISNVVANGPAAAAGLRGGNNPDVIISIDGRSITEFDDLLGYIVQYTTVGQSIELELIRNGSRQIVDLTLGARPTS